MTFEKEITVEVDLSYSDLKKILTQNNFIIKEEYEINDIYMLDGKYEISSDYLDTLKHCVLLRNIIEKNKEVNKITYKYKEYNEKKEIVKQAKVDCNIKSINEAKNLFEALGYKELIKINDHAIVVANDCSEFVVQLVNDKHIYIEIEQKCHYLDKAYKNIDEMKNEVIKYNIPIKNNDFYAKKAENELKELLDSKRD